VGAQVVVHAACNTLSQCIFGRALWGLGLGPMLISKAGQASSFCGVRGRSEFSSLVPLVPRAERASSFVKGSCPAR
jgi:hypothetical protein